MSHRINLEDYEFIIDIGEKYVIILINYINNN